MPLTETGRAYWSIEETQALLLAAPNWGYSAARIRENVPQLSHFSTKQVSSKLADLNLQHRMVSKYQYSASPRRSPGKSLKSIDSTLHKEDKDAYSSRHSPDGSEGRRFSLGAGNSSAPAESSFHDRSSSFPSIDLPEIRSRPKRSRNFDLEDRAPDPKRHHDFAASFDQSGANSARGLVYSPTNPSHLAKHDSSELHNASQQHSDSYQSFLNNLISSGQVGKLNNEGGPSPLLQLGDHSSYSQVLSNLIQNSSMPSTARLATGSPSSIHAVFANTPPANTSAATLSGSFSSLFPSAHPSSHSQNTPQFHSDHLSTSTAASLLQAAASTSAGALNQAAHSWPLHSQNNSVNSPYSSFGIVGGGIPMVTNLGSSIGVPNGNMRPFSGNVPNLGPSTADLRGLVSLDSSLINEHGIRMNPTIIDNDFPLPAKIRDSLFESPHPVIRVYQSADKIKIVIYPVILGTTAEILIPQDQNGQPELEKSLLRVEWKIGNPTGVVSQREFLSHPHDNITEFYRLPLPSSLTGPILLYQLLGTDSISLTVIATKSSNVQGTKLENPAHNPVGQETHEAAAVETLAVLSNAAVSVAKEDGNSTAEQPKTVAEEVEKSSVVGAVNSPDDSGSSDESTSSSETRREKNEDDEVVENAEVENAGASQKQPENGTTNGSAFVAVN